MKLEPDERVLLIGYSKGTADSLEALVAHPEIVPPSHARRCLPPCATFPWEESSSRRRPQPSGDPPTATLRKSTGATTAR